MKPFTWIIPLVLMALVFSNIQLASAAIVTVEVTGLVNYLVTGGGFALDGSVVVASEMTGFCSYDTDTPDEYPEDEVIGIYPVISISMTIGNYTFTHDLSSPDYAFFEVATVDPSYIVDSPDPRFDGTIYANGAPKTYDDINWDYRYLQLFHFWTSSDEYIPTDALPDLDSWPDLSVFNNRRRFMARFYGEGSDYFDIRGEITSLTIIPEPATLLLLGLGSLALLRRPRSSK